MKKLDGIMQNIWSNCIYLYFNALIYFSDKSFRILIHHKKYSTKVIPKITTHYTVVPRENDPRWQGIFSINFAILIYYFYFCL